MNNFWAFVRTTTGGFIKVTIQADTQYNATQMLRSIYGSNLISEAAHG